MKRQLRPYLETGTVVLVHSLLKKNGATYHSFVDCAPLVDGRRISENSYAVPISYFFLEPVDLSVREELKSIYSANHIPYMNHKLDRDRFIWLKDKIGRFMSITIVDNVIGPSNSNPEKIRHWPVWKWQVEITDEELQEAYDGYSSQDLEDMYRDAMNGDLSNSWNID